MNGGFDIASLLPLVLIFVVMYFLIIRPQNKKAKEHQNMIQNIKKGDRIVMNGGVIGTVLKVDETELELEIAKGVHVKVARPMVATVQTGEAKTAPKAVSKAAPAKKKAVKK